MKEEKALAEINLPEINQEERVSLPPPPSILPKKEQKPIGKKRKGRMSKEEKDAMERMKKRAASLSNKTMFAFSGLSYIVTQLAENNGLVPKGSAAHVFSTPPTKEEKEDTSFWVGECLNEYMNLETIPPWLGLLTAFVFYTGERVVQQAMINDLSDINPETI